MERDFTVSIKVALVLLVGMFASTAYRAATAPVTAEEALAFNRAIGLPAAEHLSFIFPAMAVMIVWGWGGRSAGQRMRDLVIPTVVTAVILLALPLSHADAVGFPAGGGSLLRGWSLAAIPLVIGAAWRGRRIGAWMAGIAAITFVLLVVARRLLGAPYATGASGVYWVPLLTLAAL